MQLNLHLPSPTRAFIAYDLYPPNMIYIMLLCLRCTALPCTALRCVALCVCVYRVYSSWDMWDIHYLVLILFYLNLHILRRPWIINNNRSSRRGSANVHIIANRNECCLMFSICVCFNPIIAHTNILYAFVYSFVRSYFRLLFKYTRWFQFSSF